SDQRWQGYVDRLTAELEADEPVSLHQSAEYAVQIIRGLVTGTPTRINASVMNDGAIENLPANCCVEVPCMVDKGRISPCHVGPIPPQLAALNMSNVGLQESAVEAVLERDLRKAYYAVALDPHAASRLTLPEMRSMFDEMVDAQTDSLAAYIE
ncbi:MAG TPA: alpha-glucosidase/alpha-galactosidase, partial [Armatimonadota bacterium]|nr:alpha-glucosidase/alpha-galactosidase [Armatimonadota bacterium]